MKINYLLFSSLLIVSCFNTANAFEGMTRPTRKLYFQGMKGCYSSTTKERDMRDYFDCLDYETGSKVAIITPSCSKNIKKTLKEMGCQDDFIKNFTRAYTQDNLEALKEILADTKSKYDSFKSKGLTASAQVSRYMEIVENNGLEEFVEIDSTIQKEMKNNKAKFMARKNTCSDVMNLKEPLSVDEPRNQGSIGWCYAYASSDLLSHALGKKVSAAQLSGLFNDKLIAKVFAPSGEGGLTVSTLEQAQKFGVCLESDLPSEDFEFSDTYGGLDRLFANTRMLGVRYSQKITTIAKGKDKEMTSKPKFTHAEVKADLCLNWQPLLEAYQEIFPRLTVDQISQLLMKSGVHAFTEMTKSCAAQKDDELASLEIKREWRNSKLYPAIDEQLDKGNILGISYHAGMLEDSSNGSIFANHASTIVGRRFNEATMSCEYLLRNTWGRSCSGYSIDYECSNGHVWIGEEYFKHKNSIFEVEYVEKK